MPSAETEWHGKVSEYIKVSILNASNRKPIRPIDGGHVGTAGSEVEDARKYSAANRAAPIVANTVTIRTTDVAAARPGQFKRGGKCPGFVIAAPTRTLSIKLGFCW